MADEQNNTHEHRGSKGGNSAGMCGGVYGMAFVGAAIYFIQHAQSFWGGVLGFFEAVVWPAVVMYKVLDLLKF